MIRYINWPLAISPAALEEVQAALEHHLNVFSSCPGAIELQNMANEARSMLQRLPPKPVIDPMLE